MSVPPDNNSHETPKTEERKEAKQALRRSLRDMRNALSSQSRAQWDHTLSEHLLTCLKSYPVKSLGVYWPFQNEPDLLALYGTLSDQGIELSLPTVVDKNAPLAFLQWKPGDALVNDSFGIAIPAKQVACLPEAVLAPCLGFTKTCYRLGYGGGFFDRTLDSSPHLYTIGIAYACQMSDFEIEPFDIPLDCVITENGIIPKQAR